MTEFVMLLMKEDFMTEYEELKEAVQNLLEDVRARYPDEPLYCPYLRRLDELVNGK